MDWFLYDRDLCHKKVKEELRIEVDRVENRKVSDC